MVNELTNGHKNEIISLQRSNDESLAMLSNERRRFSDEISQLLKNERDRLIKIHNQNI